MRIGFYGGLANNMYVFAKAVHGLGHDVLLIEDISDTYPMSQPLWQDMFLTIDYDILKNGKWNDALNPHKVHWEKPSWVVDVNEDHQNASLFSLKKSFIDKVYWRRLYKTPLRERVLSIMQKCDLLVVCGVEGETLAYFSNKPYVIWPHGGDMRLAAGFPPLKKELSFAVFKEKWMRWTLKKSFNNALAVGTHDPQGFYVEKDNLNIFGFMGKKPIHYLPLPLIKQKPLSCEDKIKERKRLRNLFDVDVPEDCLFVFIPSRVDFYWKGHDKLLTALSQTRNVYVILSGWGNDYDRAKHFIDTSNLGKRVFFLKNILSKPYLFSFFKAADLVIDQFHLGTYGTSAIEAMACGAPVMMYINNEVFEKRGWEPPPVINVKSADDIRASLLGIEKGTIDLQKKGEECLEWVKRVHSPENAYDCLMKCVNW